MSGETFLIVDDARLARQMVRSFVSRARTGMAILEAAEGEQALKVLEGVTALDYATIDYNMPGMNGIDLAALVKERFPTARIALLTANVQAALRKRAAELGIGFIDKPINETKIVDFLGPTP
jgi:DNA-binding NarL/FixJ family response regulator